MSNPSMNYVQSCRLRSQSRPRTIQKARYGDSVASQHPQIVGGVEGACPLRPSSWAIHTHFIKSEGTLSNKIRYASFLLHGIDGDTAASLLLAGLNPETQTLNPKPRTLKPKP
jgi:hypothetical protein